MPAVCEGEPSSARAMLGSIPHDTLTRQQRQACPVSPASRQVARQDLLVCCSSMTVGRGAATTPPCTRRTSPHALLDNPPRRPPDLRAGPSRGIEHLQFSRGSIASSRQCLVEPLHMLRISLLSCRPECDRPLRCSRLREGAILTRVRTSGYWRHRIGGLRRNPLRAYHLPAGAKAVIQSAWFDTTPILLAIRHRAARDVRSSTLCLWRVERSRVLYGGRRDHGRRFRRQHTLSSIPSGGGRGLPARAFQQLRLAEGRNPMPGHTSVYLAPRPTSRLQRQSSEHITFRLARGRDPPTRSTRKLLRRNPDVDARTSTRSSTPLFGVTRAASRQWAVAMIALSGAVPAWGAGPA